MVEVQPNKLGAREAFEIPAYVIKAPRPRAHAYQAPRLSRTSLRDLTDASQRHLLSTDFGGRFWPLGRAKGPVLFGSATDLREVKVLPKAVRYPVPGASPVGQQQRVIGALASLLAAASIGLAMGVLYFQLPVSQRTSQPAAGLLIAGQNLQDKLPVIEAFSAGHVGALEAGRRATNVVYIVRSGDDFGSIAARFGLKSRTIRLTNFLSVGARPQVGQRLVITPVDGAYHRAASGETWRELADRYRVSMDDLKAYNPHLSRNSLNRDQLIFIPGASKIRTRESAIVGHRGYRRGAGWSGRLNVSRSLVGAFGSRVGGLSWPANGQMSSPFGVRGYSFHPGVDICNVIGTPIRAAKAGTVLSAGWMGAYGYAVDIDHGGGVVTRYAHCSRVLVTEGQSVNAGDQVAKMGSTGRSTGPHVHFELRIQGRAVNPTGFF